MDKVAADTIHTAARQAGKVMAEIMTDTAAAINMLVAAVGPLITAIIRQAAASQAQQDEPTSSS
jgi:hypothetical protein